MPSRPCIEVEEDRLERALTESRLLAKLAVDLLEQAERRLDDAAARALTQPDLRLREEYLQAIGASWKAVEAASEAQQRLASALG